MIPMFAPPRIDLSTLAIDAQGLDDEGENQNRNCVFNEIHLYEIELIP